MESGRDLPDNFKVIASTTETTPVAAMQHGNKDIFVQFRPE